MRKTILLISILSISLISCRKHDFSQDKIDLGNVPTSTQINKIYPIISDGKSIVVDMSVTQGAKYNLQVTNLSDKSIKSYGFTAQSENYVKNIDLSELSDGDYNLILIDIRGNMTKTPIIIKK
jgi:hypothetical protein